MSFLHPNKKDSIIAIEQPEAGFDILCFSSYMYAATKTAEFLPVEKRAARIGNFELLPDQSRVVKIGNGGAKGCYATLSMIPPSSLLYLGIFPNAKVNEFETELLIFQQLENGSPRRFPRNLFGIEGKDEYQNFLVCCFYSKNFIGITTRFNASRAYKHFVEFEKEGEK